jgi:hypothetical protein
VFLQEAVRPDLSGNVHTMYNYCSASYWPRAVSFYFQCKFLKFKVHTSDGSAPLAYLKHMMSEN